jgi:hypothetical protein
MGNWYSATKAGTRVVVNRANDPDVALIESLRVESGKPTILDEIPDALFLSAFSTRNIALEDEAFVLASIRTRLKPLAVALQAADTVEGIHGVIARINDFEEIRAQIQTTADANLQSHAADANRLDHMRVGILVAVVDLEALCIQSMAPK